MGVLLNLDVKRKILRLEDKKMDLLMINSFNLEVNREINHIDKELYQLYRWHLMAVLNDVVVPFDLVT